MEILSLVRFCCCEKLCVENDSSENVVYISLKKEIVWVLRKKMFLGYFGVCMHKNGNSMYKGGKRIMRNQHLLCSYQSTVRENEMLEWIFRWLLLEKKRRRKKKKKKCINKWVTWCDVNKNVVDSLMRQLKMCISW